MKVKFIVLLLALVGLALPAASQKAAIKTNLLYDATATLNGGVEVKFAPKWTGDLSANLNAWAIKDHPVEALAGAARGALLVLRGFLGPLRGRSPVGRPV